MFSEQDVDRELKAALSVSPSPDFEARVLQRVERVRQRVDNDRPARSAAPYGWFAAAASVVIVAGLFYALNRTPVGIAPPAPPATPPILARTAPPAPTTAPVVPLVKEIDRPRVQTVRVSRIAPRAAQAEVIVPVNQMEAVRRLVRAVNEGRIAAPSEAVETPVAVLKDVVVTPLVVDPIPVPALEPDADAPSPIIRGHK